MKRINISAIFRPKSMQTRRFSDNPMFPQRAIPEIQIPADQNKTKDPSKDESFLFRHGGKVALFAFGISIWLIYTYFEGNKNSSKLEDQISNEAFLEPIEINELRDTNFITSDEYKDIVNKTLMPGASDSSYKEFVVSIESYLGRKIKSGHLFDRFFLLYAKKLDPSSSSIELSELKISIPLFLVVLNMAMGVPGPDRIESLFHLAQRFPLVSEQNTDPSDVDGDKIDTNNAVQLISLLIQSSQLPPDKNVTETGVKWPIRTYRRKNAEEMVKGYFTNLKPPINEVPAQLTRDEFQRILRSRQVCVWGECWR